MKNYDISQELFTSHVFPGDPLPEYERIMAMERGDDCNLTYLKLCAHNGTHMDAPYHFAEQGRTIDQIAPEQTVGLCDVISFDGVLDGKTAKRASDIARSWNGAVRRGSINRSCPRFLFPLCAADKVRGSRRCSLPSDFDCM